MFVYESSQRLELLDKSDVFVREVLDGIYHIVKEHYIIRTNEYVKRDYIVHYLNKGMNVVVEDADRKMVANFKI